MDHVIEYILDYMEHDVDVFRREWASGKYHRIAQCPTYGTVKSYCDAIRALDRENGEYAEYTPGCLAGQKGG